MIHWHEQRSNGPSFRPLHAIDHCNRERLGTERNFSPPAERTTDVLAQITEWCGKPAMILGTNAREYISGAVSAWTE